VSGLARALTCHRAWWHGTARLLADSAVPGPLLRHALALSGTARRACRTHAMPCWTARLENNSYVQVESFPAPSSLQLVAVAVAGAGTSSFGAAGSIRSFGVATPLSSRGKAVTLR